LHWREEVSDRKIWLQVTIGCADHGKLMADLWMSSHQILGSILVHTKAQAEGYKAVAKALQNRERVVTEGCERLQRELIAQHVANSRLQEQLKQLQKRLDTAEMAVWVDKGTKKQE
jgi:hypothetical protein